MLKKIENLKGFKKLTSHDLKNIKGGNINEICYVMCPVDYSCKGYECYLPDIRN